MLRKSLTTLFMFGAVAAPAAVMAQADEHEHSSQDGGHSSPQTERGEHREVHRDYNAEHRAAHEAGVTRREHRRVHRDIRRDHREVHRETHQDVHRDQQEYHREAHQGDLRRGEHRQVHRDINRDHGAYHSGWDNSWRRDQRYDWYSNRQRYGDLYQSRYYDPFGSSNGYRRYSIGFNLGSRYYSSNYWLNDPYQYRLPPARGSLRWVRYYNDVLLVDLRSGRVVDAIYGFFW